MIELTPFRQKAGCCGPASLKIVLESYGVRVSQKRLTRLMGCEPSRGVGAEGMKQAAEALGFRCLVKDGADLGDIRRYLRRGVPVIVDWFAFFGGHYSVVFDMDRENVYMQDPGLGHVRALRIRDFKLLWFDFPLPFLRSGDDLILRRMIVVQPPRKPRGTEAR